MENERCGCGCGGIAKPGNRFINGHNASTKGFKMPDSAKKKLSILAKGRKLSDEHKKKLFASRKGKPITEEHKLRISLANKGRKPAITGGNHSEETKLLISIGNMRCRTDGYCDAWSDKEFKDDCRKDVCERCGMTKDEHFAKWGKNLDLHHVDGDKENCHPDNLSTMCKICHGIEENGNPEKVEV